MTDIPLDARGAPDLQQLVQNVGGYDKITSEMWKAFDHAMADYQARHRYRHNQLSGRYET